MLTAFVTVALYTGSETAHAALIVIKKTNMTAGGANMTNASAAGANMTKNATK